MEEENSTISINEDGKLCQQIVMYTSRKENQGSLSLTGTITFENLKNVKGRPILDKDESK